MTLAPHAGTVLRTLRIVPYASHV